MSATIGENIKLHRHCLSRKRNVHLRLANEIRFSMHGQCDAVNANCIDVVQQNSCKISADDAMSLIELYRSGLGASEMFPRLLNTEYMTTKVYLIPASLYSVIIWKFFCYTAHYLLEIQKVNVLPRRGLTFRLKTPRRRETFLSFERGKNPFGIIQKFVMKITFILSACPVASPQTFCSN